MAQTKGREAPPQKQQRGDKQSGDREARECNDRARRTTVRSHCGNAMAPGPPATEEDGPECEPLVTEPQATEDGIPVLLSSSFYVISGSIRLQARALKPLRMALDTGAGYNLIHKRILPRGYEEYLTRDRDTPAL